MAGMGKRMRPHTLTVPKPLISIAGKPIVQRLVEDIAKVCEEPIDEVAFVINRAFGAAVEEQLKAIAANLGATGSIAYQDDPMGTAHAILCAEKALEGKVVVAFADTLFHADFQLDESQEGIIWVQKVEDPSAFGVVKLEDGVITDFVEKPEEFVSDLAIIGIYYFKDGANLRKELQYLIDHDIRIKGGEFGLTDALENMKQKGLKFVPGQVDEWLDCGNKDATVHTNSRVLAHFKASHIDPTAHLENTMVIGNCFIGANTVIKDSIIGPGASIEDRSFIEKSVIQNTIIGGDTVIVNAVLENSLVGSHAGVRRKSMDLSISDFSQISI